MKVAVDVHYRETEGLAAAVGFIHWSDAEPAFTATARIAVPADYEPGAFYKRELPAILAVLEQLPEAPELVIVDAYVDLGSDRPGLGRRLYDAVGLPVIGVAKTRFAEADVVEVLRGASKRPLFVTAAGIDAHEAAARIEAMHGSSRIPTLLKLVDGLSRSG